MSIAPRYIRVDFAPIGTITLPQLRTRLSRHHDRFQLEVHRVFHDCFDGSEFDTYSLGHQIIHSKSNPNHKLVWNHLEELRSTKSDFSILLQELSHTNTRMSFDEYCKIAGMLEEHFECYLLGKYDVQALVHYTFDGVSE